MDDFYKLTWGKKNKLIKVGVLSPNSSITGAETRLKSVKDAISEASRFHFFRRGLAAAVFNDAGEMPERNEQFIICKKTTAKERKHIFKSL